MARTSVNLPDGRTVEIDHPEGATQDQILRFAKQQFEAGAFDQPQPTRAEQLQEAPFMDRVKNDLGIIAGNVSAALRGIPEGLVDAAAPFANPLGHVANLLSPGDLHSTNVSRDFEGLLTSSGVPDPETASERGLNLGARLYSGIKTSSNLFDRLTPQAPPSPARPTPRQQALQAGHDSGLVVPPATANPSSRAAFLEGMGGKLKTGQMASARNQPVINRLAARAIGLGDDVDITPTLLSDIRKKAGSAYAALRGTGTVTADDTFRSSIDDAVSSFNSTADDFERLASTTAQVRAIADDIVGKKTFDANSAVAAVQRLRDLADEAFRSGDGGIGSAYKKMANAFENILESHAASIGEPGMVENVRRAREVIAKTYTIQNALRGTNVDAAALARALDRGKPLTNELETIARFAQEFPKAARVGPAIESIPAYSPLDLMASSTSLAGAGVGGLMTGNPSVAAAALLPAVATATRPAIRNLLFSGPVQRSVMPGTGPVHPGLLAPSLPISGLLSPETQ